MLKIKIVLLTLFLSFSLLSVASVTIFKPEPNIPFFDQMTSYDKFWKCKNFHNCKFIIYPDKTGKLKGVQYNIPESIIKKIIKTYMKEGKLKYS